MAEKQQRRTLAICQYIRPQNKTIHRTSLSINNTKMKNLNEKEAIQYAEKFYSDRKSKIETRQKNLDRRKEQTIKKHIQQQSESIMEYIIKFNIDLGSKEHQSMINQIKKKIRKEVDTNFQSETTKIKASIRGLKRDIKNKVKQLLQEQTIEQEPNKPYLETPEIQKIQSEQMSLRTQWINQGRFVYNGIQYQRGINDYQAQRVLIRLNQEADALRKRIQENQ